MTNDKHDLNKTEMRQGNSRMMNSRALVWGTIAVVIALGLVLWFSFATYDDTDTTVGGGLTLDDVQTQDDAVGGDVDALPVPTPQEEAAPAVEVPTPADTPTPAQGPAPEQAEPGEVEAPVGPGTPPAAP